MTRKCAFGLRTGELEFLMRTNSAFLDCLPGFEMLGVTRAQAWVLRLSSARRTAWEERRACYPGLRKEADFGWNFPILPAQAWNRPWRRQARQRNQAIFPDDEAKGGADDVLATGLPMRYHVRAQSHGSNPRALRAE